MPKADAITCIAKDENGYLYAGGDTERNWIFVTGGIYLNKAMLIKLDESGDTVFVRDIGIPGRIYSIAIDPYGMIRANIREYYSSSTLFVTLTPDGFVFHKDSIGATFPRSCIIGKDSSLIVVGEMARTGVPAERSMYFQRIQKDGSKDPLVELNPNHPNCVANRVEQLPNGHYLVSGYVGSRIASYELNEWGQNPVFKQWYQTIDFSNLTAGHVGQVGSQNWLTGAQGNPCIIGLYDSLGNKVWLRKEPGLLIPPQGMTDGTVVAGLNSGQRPFWRLRHDSSTIWNINIKDTLTPKGILGNIDLKSFVYFEDQSALVSGTQRYDTGQPTDTKEDPIFIKIANVGTPVTSLIKPKKGPLANETLAPWPNPTGRTLYLKQHFDKAEIHLYNLSGKEMGEYRIGFAQPIDISGYGSGVYLYRTVIDGKFYSGKVIKR